MYLMILHHNLQKAEKFKFENQDIFANAVDKKDEVMTFIRKNMEN